MMKNFVLKAKAMGPLLLVLLFASRCWAQDRLNNPNSCDKGLQLVSSDTFATATTKGDFIVVSYTLTDSSVLRIQQGFVIGVRKNVEGVVMDGLMDMRKSYTGTPKGEILLGVFQDMDIIHKTARFSGIEGNILILNPIGGTQERMSFNPKTKFCLADRKDQNPSPSKK